MNDFPVRWQRDFFGVLNQAIDIRLCDFLFGTRNSNYPPALITLHMIAGDACHHGSNLRSGLRFGICNRRTDGRNGAVNVRDHAPRQAVGFALSYAENIDLLIRSQRCDNGAHLGGSDIKTDINVFHAIPFFLFAADPAPAPQSPDRGNAGQSL